MSEGIINQFQFFFLTAEEEVVLDFDNTDIAVGIQKCERSLYVKVLCESTGTNNHRFMRIRVEIQVSSPLRRGVKLRGADGQCLLLVFSLSDFLICVISLGECGI